MYFISPEIYLKQGVKGLGVYAKNDIPANVMLELSPISSCWKSTWEETPYHLKKLVFSFPMNTNNYVIVLGYVSLYNHDDNNNAYWNSCDIGVGIITRRDINKDEEICVNYGDGYWNNGWTKL